jgi:hypothetical protein
VSASLGPAAEAARRLKVDLVRRTPPEESADLRATALFSRGGRVVGQVMAGYGPESVREATYAAALFFRAEELLVVTDAFGRFVPDEERGALAGIAHGAFAADWAAGRREGLSEVITAIRVPREGDASIESWPYVREGRRVIWTDPSEMTGRIDGVLVDCARTGFAQGAESWRRLWSEVRALTGLEEGDPMVEVHVDRAAARVASERLPGAIVALHEPQGDRAYQGGVLLP